MFKKNEVRKGVIVVAGMGTRFLPATKAMPKEMLPVLDKPVVQYIVEEMAASGIKEIILCADNKKDIDDIKADYLKGLTFKYVSQMTEVLQLALLK